VSRLSIKNNIKRGSDHAITETANRQGENKIANVPRKARAGKDNKCLKVSLPPKYTIRPKISAFTILASKRGSVLKMPPTRARSMGNSGGK
jgi:hypothetical protein